ncbi:hypothetical protein FOA52_013915 [Chlamydomonas sp. UWO 241]|nr:hypothetical protein FOA52_013915 [Chlamydomonas sp. UWO 241]
MRPPLSDKEPLCKAVSPGEVKERVKAQWSTLALVSALLVTLTIPHMISPALGGRGADKEEQGNGVGQAHIVLISILGILSICIVFVCSYMMAEIDLCSADEQVVEFMEMFAVPQQIIWTFFHFSVYTLLASILLAVFYQNIAVVAWVVIGCAMCFLAVSLGINYMVDSWMKFRLAALQRDSTAQEGTLCSAGGVKIDLG